MLTPVNGMASNVGKRYPSEKQVIADRVTGRSITVLTSSQFDDSKPYHTHDTWTADGDWIVFRSNCGGNGSQLFAVNELTGDIVQLTDSPGAQTINLSRKEMKMFYIREQQGMREVIELNIGGLIADSMTGQMKDPVVYERVVASLPDGCWAVGDTNAGNIILIKRAMGEQILLSTGHPMTPDHAHPIFSRDSKRVLIQSALLTDGKNLNLMVINVP